MQTSVYLPAGDPPGGLLTEQHRVPEGESR